MMNGCPLCDAPIAGDMLMCVAHWKLIPRAEADRVYRERGAVRRAQNRDVKVAAIRRYREACAAAIRAVKTKGASL